MTPYLLFGIFLFNIYNNVARKVLNTFHVFETPQLTEKILENVIVSGTHSYLCIYYFYLYLFYNDIYFYNNAVTISTAYYIYDVIRMINNYNYTLYENTYILHHVISFGIIYYNIAYYSKELYILAEFSNIFYFPVYYSKKIKINLQVEGIFQLLQFVSYIICRVGLISYYYYLSFFMDNYYVIIFGTPLTLMGYIWSYQLYLQIK
tara:strand:- start:31526 stop:32143 length:618 start_codon:yes stop_codon:yes gene_type:complete